MLLRDYSLKQELTSNNTWEVISALVFLGAESYEGIS